MVAFKALQAQLTGWLSVVVMLAFGLLAQPNPLALGLLQGGIAAGASLAMRQPPWWLPIHLAFGLTLILASRLQLAPGWFLGAFVLLGVVYWTPFRSRVPLYLSNRRTAAAVLALLPQRPGARLLDAGSGLGCLLAAAAERRPDALLEGVETAPLPWLVARLRLHRHANCRVRRADLWRQRLGDYDLVYAFLSPVPMPALWRKARAEMRPGSLLVSNSFAVPGVAPSEVIQVRDGRATRLYLYRM